MQSTLMSRRRALSSAASYRPLKPPGITTSVRSSWIEQYRSRLRQPETELRDTLSPTFAGKEFLLVRGFLTDALDRLGMMMEDQIRAIEHLGRPVRKVAAPSTPRIPPT